MWEQNTDIVMVDTGNSYEGLCEYVGGKYISYTEEHPITMNPFRIKREEYNVEKVGFLKNLVMLIWKGTQGTVTKTEDKLIEQTITEYYDSHFSGKIDTLCFNTFYEFSVDRIPQICEENHLTGIDLAAYNYLMKDFYKGGNHEVTLNEDLDTSLFDETFIVFEIDSIKDDPLLFPLVTLIIMDLFIQKMRIKKNRKVLVIEEAWKAIASPMMAEYIKYLYKTARKFWASVGVVTQEIQDIVGSPIVKEAIINNSDVVMLLDQSKFRERFDEIQAILGLTEVDCRKIFTINRLENKQGRSFFREVFIRRGQVGAVYGVEEPHGSAFVGRKMPIRLFHNFRKVCFLKMKTLPYFKIWTFAETRQQTCVLAHLVNKEPLDFSANRFHQGFYLGNDKKEETELIYHLTIYSTQK